MGFGYQSKKRKNKKGDPDSVGSTASVDQLPYKLVIFYNDPIEPLNYQHLWLYKLEGLDGP